MPVINVGIDVGKDDLAVAVLPSGESFTEVNDERAVTRLVKRLGALECERIVVEASGGYETLVAGALAAAGLPVAGWVFGSTRTQPLVLALEDLHLLRQ